MDLFDSIQELMDELNVSISKLREHGNKLAEAEKNYKVLLRQEALKLRQEKNMPVTLSSRSKI